MKKKSTQKNKKPIITPKEDKASKFDFVGLDGKKYSLNLKQKLFCEFYLELGGNGVDAIIEAGYDITDSRGVQNKRLAASMASENLTKPNIYEYVKLLFEEYGYTDENVEKQHLFLINQFGDLSAKAKGIDMFYKKKGAYKNELEVKFINYRNMSIEDLNKEIAKHQT